MEPTARQAFQFMLLDDHEVIIYGVLKRLNIRPFQQQYDDLAQEGRLAFICAYQKYPHERENHPKMMNYIYQAVYWKLLDVLRQKTRQTAKISGGVTELTNQIFTATPDYETELLFGAILQKLDSSEQQLLRGLYLEGKTISCMARELQVSRKTLYQWRLRIQQKAVGLLGNTFAR